MSPDLVVAAAALRAAGAGRAAAGGGEAVSLGEQRDQWCTELNQLREAESIRKGGVNTQLPSEEPQGINAEKARLKALIKSTRQSLE